MGLRRIILNLSYNKDNYFEAYGSNGYFNIIIKECYSNRELCRASYNLEKDIEQQNDITQRLSCFFGKKEVNKKPMIGDYKKIILKKLDFLKLLI